MLYYILYFACKMQHTKHCIQNVASVIIRLKKNIHGCLHGALRRHGISRDIEEIAYRYSRV